MAKQVQYRRGTTAQHATFTGAQGEITVDTSKNVVIVHDGSTTGGIPMATNAEVVSLGTLLFSNAAVQAATLNILQGNAVAQSQAIDIINANVAAANTVINAVGNLQNITTAIGPDSSGTRDLGFVDRQWRTVYISANVNTGNINAGKYYFANGAPFGLDDVTTSISTLTSNAAAQAVSIDNIYANLAIIVSQGNVQITDANVAAANARILTLETDLGTAQTDIINLGSNAATQQTQIDTLQFAQIGANADILAVNLYAQSYADQAITNLVNGAPAALDTLYEIANSLGNNSSLSTTVINTIANVQANVTAANAAITTIDANLGTATTNITTLFGNAATQSGLIDTINANVAAANVIISSIGSGTIDGINANVTAANVEILAVQANVTAANSAITTLDANLGTVTTNITTLFGNAATQYSEIDGIRANVEAANVAIAGLVAGTGFATVTQLDTNVQAISANLGTVTNNITTLFGNAASQAGNISQVIGDVSSLQSNAASQQTQINELQGNSATLAGDIGTVSSAQTGFNLSLQLLDSNIGTIVGTTIPGLDANITAANGSITTLDANLGTTSTAVGNLQANITAANSAISTLDANLGTVVSTTIPGLDANLGTVVATTIPGLDANVGTIVGTTIPGLQANITAANSAITAIDGNLGTTSTAVGNLQANITAANSAIQTLDANVGTIVGTTIPGLQTQVYANANVAAYLPTYTGNILAGNINVNGTGSALSLITIYGSANANASLGMYNSITDVGAQIYLGDSNFNTSARWNSAPGIGATYDSNYGGLAGALGLYTYTGNDNSRTLRVTVTAAQGQVQVHSTADSYGTTTGALTVAGGVGIGGNLNVSGNITQQSAYYETYSNVTNSGGNLTCNFVDSTTFYATLTANVTVNFTNVVATAGRVTGATLIVDQGATAYRVANLQINSGGIQTIKYAGATPGVGTASNTDVMSFSLISLDGTNWRVLGQISNYG